MRIGVLSGAVKNAGDFLIEKRSLELIKYHYPSAEIRLFKRNIPLDCEIDRINQCDFIVMAGGPLLQPNLYPVAMPLVENLSLIQCPVYALGLGWKGKHIDELYTTYKFTDQMRALISKMSEHAPVSCRDWHTVRVLQQNGYDDCIMTGCPAWYCLEFLQYSDMGKQLTAGEETICISDPANEKNIDFVIPLVRAVRSIFPDSPIIYVVHRDKVNDVGLNAKYNKHLKTLTDALGKWGGVEQVCIANGSKGFAIYDTCKFHIGFRVHAHIYNLSRGKQSILINEDARGRGVNDALGLENIEPETWIRIAGERTGRIQVALQARNPEIAFQNKIEHYLDMNVQTHGFIYKRAWNSRREYYNAMCEYIKSWER